MKRLKSNDLNLIGELANQHPDLAERLKVIRSHLAYIYGQQCARYICDNDITKGAMLETLRAASTKVAKNPERAAEIRANWTDE